MMENLFCVIHFLRLTYDNIIKFYSIICKKKEEYFQKSNIMQFKMIYHITHSRDSVNMTICKLIYYLNGLS